MYFHGLLIDNSPFFIDKKKDQTRFTAIPVKTMMAEPVYLPD